MSFSRIVSILKVRYKIILFTILATVLTGAVITALLPKNYKATATVIVNYKGADPVTGIALPAQLMPGYMATQVDIISSKNVAKRVIKKLNLAEIPAVQNDFQESADGRGDLEDWLAELLLKKLDVKPSRESSVIDISFFGVNPQFSATIANEFANAYMQAAVQLKVEPSQKAAEYFTEQIKSLRNDLKEAQQNLSDYQQEKGIVSIDERMDVERARLNDLSSQLVSAQAQTMEAQSRERNSTGKSAYESPDVAANPIIQSLKTEIARAESKFADISQKFERNHPLYQGSKAEIDNLKAELARQIQSASGNVASNSRILQQRENEIRSALNQQKTKLLQLNKDRDALTILTREVENAQKSYDVTMQRYTQSNMEGQSNQSEVALLNAAVPPIDPASPKVVLNIIMAVLLGIFLGVVAAIGAEYLDPKVRTPEDLLEVIQAPLLGVISQEKKRLKFFRQNTQLIKY